MYISNNEDLKALEDIILGKKYFRNRGKDIPGHCSTFEKNFAEKIGTDYSVMVNSGTNALVCALKALDLKADDEVIIPSFTFFATAAAVVNSGAKVVIVNIDSSLSLDPHEVKLAITDKTKAIIAVHMDGHPCDMDSLETIANEHKLVLIEDVAQATGGSYKGKRLGSIGEFGCFSFNVDKIISCGEGGAVTMKTREHFEKALCIQDACCSFGPTFKESFTTIKPFIGESMRVSEISGALMNVQLSRLDYILDELRWRKKIIIEELAKHDIDTIASHDEAGDCATSFYLRFKSMDDCIVNLRKLASNRIIAIPINTRPAHACWQWMHLLNEHDASVYSFKKSAFLTSIDLLMSSLKINVPFEASREEVQAFAAKIIEVLKN